MNRLMKFALPALLSISVLLPIASMAQPAQRGTAVVAPDQLLRQGINRLTGYLKGASDPSPQQITRFLNEELAPFFDFQTMARLSSGPAWRRMNLQQRRAFSTRLRTTFMTALAQNLGGMANGLPKFRVFDARRGNARGQAIVRAAAYSPNRRPMRFEFRFSFSRQGWRIFDVALNGASAVAYYRRHFSALLRSRRW